jgi:hypothetical protein
MGRWRLTCVSDQQERRRRRKSVGPHFCWEVELESFGIKISFAAAALAQPNPQRATNGAADVSPLSPR